ncbi:MAG: Wzz/FepE/Etk N-terminal domain-containing protein [Candidatus Zixiibacteriota bacterium]
MCLLSLLNTIVNRRRFIILNTLFVTIAAALVSFLIPGEYKSRATILPPDSQASLGGFGDLSVAQIAHAVTNFTLPVMATPSDLYASMLKSESILKKVVDSLDLQTFYGSKTEWETVSELRDCLTVRVETDGIITVEAIANDQMLAANIVNQLVRELNRLNLSIQSRKSGLQADFLAKRIQETEHELQRAASELRQFQEEHMAISLDQQSAALIENLARQKADLTTAEVELEILKKTLSPDHPQLIRQRMLVDETKAKLKVGEMGEDSSSNSPNSAFDIPLSNIPDLYLRFSILKRNVRIQELIYEFLAQQQEMSRIQELRDVPVVNILDFARPAERPFRPRKLLITFSAFILSFMLSTLIVVAQDRFRGNGGESDSMRLQLKEMLKTVSRKPLG